MCALRAAVFAQLEQEDAPVAQALRALQDTPLLIPMKGPRLIPAMTDHRRKEAKRFLDGQSNGCDVHEFLFPARQGGESRAASPKTSGE